MKISKIRACGFKLLGMKSVIATALLAAATSSFASDFFVVVPVPAKTTGAQNINVALTGYALPAGLIGQAYTGFDFKRLLSVTGDSQYTGFGVHWSVAQGSLPAGLTLRSDGTLSGTPTAAGSASFQVMASYKSKAGQQAYQVVVANITVGLAAGTPPQALVGQSYSYDLKPLLSVTGDAAYNGSGVTWSVVSSTLPAGLYLTNDGWIGGTPTAGGTGAITARATYKTVSGQQTYQVVTLNIAVGLAAGTPPQGIVGQAYSYNLNPQLSVTGDPAYNGSGVTWSEVSSTLSAGLHLTNDGWIGGTPTAGGTGAITARATYRGVNGEQTYQVVTLNIAVGLAAGTPPQAIVGQVYSYNLSSQLSVTGDPAYSGSGVSWSVVSSTLPAGLNLTNDGWIGGTPTAGGTGTLTARATYRGVNGEQTYQVVSLNITVALASATPPQGMVSQTYSYDLKPLLSVGGDPAYNGSGVTWSVVSGVLPDGLALSSNGVISGTPSTSTTATFQIKAAYRTSAGAQSYQLFIAKLPGDGTLSVATLDFGSLPVGATTTAQTVSLTNTGGDTLTVSGFTSTGPFAATNGCPATLAPNQSCTSNVTFKPTAMGPITGTVKVSTGSGARTVNLTGTGLATLLTASPTSVSFGNVIVNASGAQSYTLKNTGNTPTTTLKYTLPAGVTAADNCGQALGAGLSCSVTVTWRPTAAGTLSGSVTIASQDSQATVGVSGAALQARLSASPTSLAFGTRQTGVTTTQAFTLSNTGNTTATSLAISVPSGYSQASNCGTALAANASCAVQVSLTPAAVTTYNGTVSVTSSAPTVGVGVTGTGGVSTFVLSTGSIAMPMANVGTSTSSAFVIFNTGTVAGTPTISATANFSATQCGSIPVGGNCTSTVFFTPTASQPASQGYGGAVFVSGSSAGTQGISLSGTGASSTAVSGGYGAGAVPVYSPNQVYALYMQGDCNLVIYRGAPVPGNAVWNSGTNNGLSCVLSVQMDGNLVVYGPGNVVEWMSSTGGFGAQPTFIQLDNNGILHMYLGTPSAPGALLWSS
jgi:hypothetical protein